jgi:hypothetical protein
MMTKGRCASCDRCEGVGHNYCRKCGLAFKPGHVENVPVAETYYADDIFCGYCGKPRDVCNETH